MTNFGNNEFVELGTLVTILYLAVILVIRHLRTPATERSTDDKSSYYVG